MADEKIDFDTWLTVERAAAILGLGERMVHRYGAAPYNRIRTLRHGRRVLYHIEDVQGLAEEIAALRASDAKSGKVEEDNERSETGIQRRKIDELEAKLFSATFELGKLEAIREEYEALKLDANALRKEIGAAEERARRAEAELAELKRQPQQQAQPQQEQPSKKKGWWRF